MLPEKYTRFVKKSFRTNRSDGRKVVDLSRHHVAAALTAAPSIFTARRTVVLPTERLELRCDHGRTRTGFVSRLLTASSIAATTFVRIWRLIHPGEFGADLVE